MPYGRGIPRTLVFFVTPAFALILIFAFGPALWGARTSFTNEALVGKEAREPEFVGLDNYLRLFSDEWFYNSLWISTVFVIGSAIIGQAGLGLLLALLTSSRRKVYKAIKPIAMVTSTFVFAAWVTPEVLAGYSWSVYLDKLGFLNSLIGQRVNWLVTQPLLSIIMANMWWGTAWSMILFKAALESIPKDLEEAADIDGAASLQKVRYVILPLLKGPALVNLILITLWTYGVFGLPYMMTAGGPFHRSELMTIYAYNTAFKFYEIGYGVTISMVLFLITSVLVIVYYKQLVRRG